MKCEHGEGFKRTRAVRVSSMLAPILALVTVIVWLPVETSLPLVVICGLACYYTVDKLHFRYIEKPAITMWVMEHMRKYHPEELEEGD